MSTHDPNDPGPPRSWGPPTPPAQPSPHAPPAPPAQAAPASGDHLPPPPPAGAPAPPGPAWGASAPPYPGAAPHPGAPRAVPPPEGGVIENAVRVVTAPVDTLRRLTHHPRIGWAIGVVVVVAVLSALAGSAGFDVTGEPFAATGLDAFQGVMLVGSVIFGPLVSLLFVIVWAAVLHGMARLLKGTGTFAGTFTGVSFAYLVTVFGVPFQLLPLALGGAGTALAGLVTFGLFIWSVVLDVIAVRECHHLTTGRAVASVLVPMAVFIALIGLFVIFIIALVVGGLAGLAS
jgi:hypothetical protein